MKENAAKLAHVAWTLSEIADTHTTLAEHAGKENHTSSRLAHSRAARIVRREAERILAVVRGEERAAADGERALSRSEWIEWLAAKRDRDAMRKAASAVLRSRTGVSWAGLTEVDAALLRELDLLVDGHAATEDAPDEECSHGVHGPWCREWTRMQKRAEAAEAARSMLRAALISIGTTVGASVGEPTSDTFLSELTEEVRLVMVRLRGEAKRADECSVAYAQRADRAEAAAREEREEASRAWAALTGRDWMQTRPPGSLLAAALEARKSVRARALMEARRLISNMARMSAKLARTMQGDPNEIARVAGQADGLAEAEEIIDKLAAKKGDD